MKTSGQEDKFQKMNLSFDVRYLGFKGKINTLLQTSKFPAICHAWNDKQLLCFHGSGSYVRWPSLRYNQIYKKVY